MLAVCAYYRGDLDQAERLAAWMRELGGLSGHSLLVARDKGTDAHPFAILEGQFDKITEIEIRDSPEAPWPWAANNIFQHCVKHIYYTEPQPFLWLEPDVVPMGPGWLTTIEEEYKTAVANGKLFLGDFVSVHTPEMDVPDHMSGIGVYPANLIDLDFNGDVMLCDSIAWDVSAAHIILPRLYRSSRIMHAWKHPKFEDMEQVQREIYEFRPDCILFHASKDGSLIEILRKGREEAKPSSEVAPPVHVASEPSPASLSSGDFAGSTPAPCDQMSAVTREPAPATESEALNPGVIEAGRASRGYKGDSSARDRDTSGGGQLICDILIKSYPQDYPLLEYCLKSLRKFASGFRQIIVVVPENEPPNLWDPSDPLYRAEFVRENGDGYMFQQQVKANAHELTDARYICHFDSDCFITRPITPATFFQNGKPIWLIAPYSKIEVPWQASTEKFLGEPVEYETMRRHPSFVPRSIHVGAAAFCLLTHGMTLKDYIMSQPTREFSEFNALGAYAYSRHRADFTWIDTHAQ